MSEMMDMAARLGNALARTEEHQALRRAISAADDDREMTELANRLQELEAEVGRALREGREPDAEVREEYDRHLTRLQASSTYQRLVAAQTNFDKIVQRVNQTIQKGLQEAAESRIILPS